MNINKRQYQLLQRLVKTRQKSVLLTPNWKALHSEFHIGRIIANHLHFSVQDLEKIRELTLYKLSIDPFYIAAEGDRLTLSSVTPNEKLSRANVFGNNVHVARFGNLPIITSGGITHTPANTALTIMDGYIDLSPYKTVMLIENGTVFNNWAALALPEECSEALIMYRGHGSGIGTTHNILKARPPACSLLCFFDFDPAGIAMALGANCDGIILPSNIDELIDDKDMRRLNKTDSFHRQWAKNASYLENNVPPHLLPVIDKVKAYQVAFTQEMLVSKKVKLKIYGNYQLITDF